MTTEAGRRILKGLEEALVMVMNKGEGHLELNHFTGEALLSGICIEEECNGDDEQFTKVSIVLDDVIYTFEENPQDGQRSCLGEVYIDDWLSIIDNFEAREVLGILRDDLFEHSISFVHPDSDEPILRIGTTDRSHDYPFFSFEFNPEVLNLENELDKEYYDGHC